MFKHMLLLCLLVWMSMSMCACQGIAPVPVPAESPPSATADALPGDWMLLSFSEGHVDRTRIRGYEFRAEEGRNAAFFYLADEDEPYPVLVDQPWVDALTEIVRQHGMLAWDGFRENAEGLMDGTSFNIIMTFSDGTSVKAGGYGRFPAGYGDASEALEAHFLQLLPEHMRSW